MSELDFQGGVPAALQLDYLPYEALREELARLAAAGRQVLGIATFGHQAPPAQALPPAFGQTPWPHVGLPSLVADTAGWAEVWTVAPDAPKVVRGLCDGAPCSHSGTLAFVWLETPLGSDDTMLAGATQQAYDTVLGALRALGGPQAWRIWNYLPDILGDRQGEERYRIFNSGRLAAFEAHATHSDGPPPAACALGQPEGASGPLVLYAIMGQQPARPIENPRQVSAYHYPPQYGLKRPQFSRASVARVAGAGAMGSQGAEQASTFVSGTASIVGHASVHADDVRAQTEETLRNIDALRAQISLDTGVVCPPGALVYKAYVRHAADRAMVEEVMRRHLGAEVIIVFLQAVVCRPDLLVEIEASSRRSVPTRVTDPRRATTPRAQVPSAPC